MMFRLLRRVRIIIELTVLAGFVLAGIGGGTLLLTRFQFIPDGLKAVSLGLLLPLAIFIFFAITALVSGRIYCSALCPFGILQDIISFIARQVSFRRLPGYRKRRNLRALRYSVLAGATVAAIGGLMLPLLLLEPFSAFWRIQNSLLRPLIILINNYLYRHFESITPLKQVPSASLSVIVASITLVAIVSLATFYGRWFCNAMCPAGALLGLLSRVSIFRLRLDHNKCVQCGACEKVCKSGCIDAKARTLDFERCVMCMDCGAACRFGAITFSPPQRPAAEPMSVDIPDASKRKFMLAMGAAVGGALILPPVIKSIPVSAKPPIMPPGAGSVSAFTSRCTACHVCVSACPGRVIRPSGITAYGVSGLMVPRLDFTAGMCEYECVTCSNICPSGALTPLSVPQKRLTRIGLVKYYQERCVVVTDGYDCGACAEHCPTGAIAMTPWKDGLRIPKVTPELCIGCGCCEHICPVSPRKAVIVDGLAVQEKAVKPEGKAKTRISNVNFPF